jgi:lysozyme
MKKGIDLYHRDDVTSWAEIASNGISFVGLKVSEGITVIDPMYLPRLGYATQNNIEPIPYQKFLPTDNGQAQAEIFCNIAKPTPSGKMMLDLESYMANGVEQWEVIAEQDRYAQLQSFLSYVLAHGFTDVIIYATKDFINQYLPNATFLSVYKLWVAEYGVSSPNLPKFWTTWTYWQYTDSGIVAGIPEPVDCNYMNDVIPA